MATKTKINFGKTLRKRCECDPADWKDCTHPWMLTRRVGTGAKRIQISLDRYLARIGDPRPLRSKGAAEEVAEMILAEHGAGTLADTMAGNRSHVRKAAGTFIEDPSQTVAALAEKFIREIVAGKASGGSDEDRLNVIMRLKPEPLRPAFGAWPVATVTREAIETVFGLAVAKSAAGDRGNSSRKKYRRIIRQLFADAVRREWIRESPAAAATMIAGMDAMRQQRCKVDISERLMAAARTLGESGKRLAVLIMAALETGARKGELLALKVGDLNLDAGTARVTAIEPGARKTGKGRTVPLSPALVTVLRAFLVGPDGVALGSNAYVFGNVIGERVRNIDRLWPAIVLLAHGITPEYGEGNRRQNLTRACWESLKRIDLKFHDLRHEAALRWHEAGVPLTAIAAMLGHANLAQLRVYLGIDQDDALAAYRAAMAAPAAAARRKPARAALSLVGGAKRSA